MQYMLPDLRRRDTSANVPEDERNAMFGEYWRSRDSIRDQRQRPGRRRAPADLDRDHRPRPRRRDARHRRAVRRDEGAARRLLPDRGRRTSTRRSQIAERIPAARATATIEVRPLVVVLGGVSRRPSRRGVPGGVRARGRDPDPRARRLRPRRGRRPGGVRDRRGALAARRRPGEPRRLDRHHRAQPRDRPAPPRADAGDEAGELARLAELAPDEEDDDVSTIPDERLALIFTCCHPALVGRRAGRAHAPAARRPDHARDRPRVPDRRGDDGAAARPRQAQDPRRRDPVPGAARRRAPRAARRRARHRLPDLQRRLLRRPRASSAREAIRLGRTARGADARRAGGARPARADAPPRLAARGAARRRRQRSSCSRIRTARAGTGPRSPRAVRSSRRRSRRRQPGRTSSRPRSPPATPASDERLAADRAPLRPSCSGSSRRRSSS